MITLRPVALFALCLTAILIVCSFGPDSWGVPVFTLDSTQLDEQGDYPPGRVGEVINRPSFISGGHKGYRQFNVVEGALPPGIRLDPSSGSFLGIPTTAGTYTFHVEASDSKWGPHDDGRFRMVWEILP